MNQTNQLTTKQVAERFGVKQVTVRVWCEKGVFKNAFKDSSPRGEFWLIPESDLENFQPQRRPGRPISKNPSKATLSKRLQREREQVRNK